MVVKREACEEDGDGHGITVLPDAYNSLVKLLKVNRKKKPKPNTAFAKALTPQQIDDVNTANDMGNNDKEDIANYTGDNDDRDCDALAINEISDLTSVLDPFELHFGDPVSSLLDFPVAAAESKEWIMTSMECPILAHVNRYILTDAEAPFAFDTKETGIKLNLQSAKIASKLHERWSIMNNKSIKSEKNYSKTNVFTSLQTQLFADMHNYRDLLFQNESEHNVAQIRNLYTLHAMNHVTKSRSKVFQNNDKLLQASLANEAIKEQKDQGFTRPKVLILVPFRQSAFEIVTGLAMLSGFKQQENKKKFKEEYSIPPDEDTIDPTKPDDHNCTFKGNIDDCFKIGVRISQKSMKIYSDFYSSDIILASPLGLRMAIGNEGDKKRDFDYLSSIEILIIDQSDVLLMQNWEHVEHIISHLNRLPTNAHGCDFSRVKTFNLEGRGLCNVAGKLKSKPFYLSGSISNVVSQIPQVFHKIECTSVQESDDKRFHHFITKILPQLQSASSKSRTILFIPSYFDYLRVKSHLKEHNHAFTLLSEYTTNQNISRARLNFFKGDIPLLLVTERFHFFRRYHLRGSFHVLFYALPERADFYAEFLNRVDVENAKGEASCSTLYTKFDCAKLERVVGKARSLKMCEKGAKEAFLFT